MKIRYLRYSIVVLVSFLSCQTQEEKDFQSCLQQAGANKSELEHVISHYEQDQDTRKLDAARFLICNMQYHYTLSSPKVAAYFVQMDSIGSLTPTRWSISPKQEYMLNTLENPFDDHLTQVYDNQVIKADELIRHIDEAFAMYDSAIWCGGVDFVTFCEYLLPYRVAEESVDLDWMQFYREKVEERVGPALSFAKNLQDTLYSILNRMSTNYRFNIEYHESYPYGYKPQQLYSIRKGTCQNYNVLSCFMFRSVGIPVAMDYIPLWGNRSLGHDFCALLINPEIIDTATVLDYSFSAAPKPLGQYLSSNPNLPTKVYRTTFSRQKESLAVIHGDEEIPHEFESMFIKDVSADYGLKNEVSVDLDSKDRDHQFYYLCSFDNETWRPIAWTKRKRGKILFPNVGCGIIYLPCKYENRKMKPVSEPIIVHKDGRTEQIHLDVLHLQTLVLHRKYTESESVRRYSHLFEGGRIEVADNKSFLNPTVLYHFPDSIGVNFHHIRLKQPFACRYIRFVPREDKCGGEVADFKVLGKEGKVLNGAPMGSTDWDKRYPISSAFDNDVLTYAKTNNGKDAWLGIDLGSNQPITEIQILPHNDDNFIRKGELYQLQYWDKGRWHTIEEQYGDDRQCLRFDLCPRNALFRLRNLTKGKEERIFTYESGKQVWW